MSLSSYSIIQGDITVVINMLNLGQNAATGGAVLLFLLIYFAVIIFIIASVWVTFEKAGQPGWGSIIPIYNTILMLKIAGKPIWWIILLFIPLVNIIVGIMMISGFSTNFGRGVGTTLGLMFLPFIFWPVLAFGSAEYNLVN